MSDRAKHIVVGILVIMSLLIIFLPAMLKNSNHNFEKNIKLALKLPNNPGLPKVDVPSDRELFKSVKVVSPQKIQIAKIDKNSLIAKAQPIEIKNLASANSQILSINDNKFNKDKNYVKIASNIEGKDSKQNLGTYKNSAPIAAYANVANMQKSPAIKKSGFFSIQVATFTQKNNAELLVDKLKNKGFYATANLIKKTNGINLYQVIVGKVNQREEAIDLQKKLAAVMQLNGFIVKSEVS